MKFGVAGYPPAFWESPYRRDRARIFQWLSELGLNAFEIQMTYGPRTKEETCIEYRSLAEEFGIRISVHAAYYIVLTSDEPDKIARSTDTLRRTFDLAELLGAETIVLHPGSLYGQASKDIQNRFIENAGKFFEKHGDATADLFIETAGKIGQLGSVDEILSISKELPRVHPCIDFGHVHARTLGTLNEAESVSQLSRRIRAFLDGNPGKRVHFHFTPIHYGQRGEIQHRAVEDVHPELTEAEDVNAIGVSPAGTPFFPRPEHVAEAIHAHGFNTTLISETRDSQERGARAVQKHFKSCGTTPSSLA